MNTQLCPHCGNSVRARSLFCNRCGQPLGPGPGATTVMGPGTATLVLRWPGGRTERHPLTKSIITLGRAPHNDIQLDFPTVSNSHLRLDVAGGQVQITDLGSTNGTHLRGAKIVPQVPHPWPPGDTVRVGDPRGNSISMVVEPAAGEVKQARDLGTQELGHLSQVIIGRDPSSQLHLQHPAVSHRHAEMVRRDGGFEIRDLGSTNGTFVNGQRIAGWTKLNTNDVIQIGPFELSYNMRDQGLSQVFTPGHSLDAMRLGMEVADDRMILEEISLSVQGGEFAALVGGSGAGKSTLLKAMNGFIPATHGDMLIDGKDLYSQLDAYRTQMGYVPQDDIIHKDLPVRKALWFSAKLRLPDASNQEIEDRIDKVLEMVDMVDHDKKPVKVLSGGQRKRVSIAVELLAEPALLFLDEPTSGLDPGLEKKMMYDLNRLADQGKTVVLVTHATANIEQCDHVAFLVRGHLAYYGPPNEAITFFQARDFADIYLKLEEEIDPATGKQPPPELASYYPMVQAQRKSTRMPAGLLWAEHYKRSPIYQRYVASRQAGEGGQGGAAPARARSRRRRPGGALLRPVTNWIRRQFGHDSALRQLVLLSRRSFSLIRYDLITLFVLLVMMPFIASLFMFVSEEDAMVGWKMTQEEVEEVLTENLEDADIDEKSEYMPYPDAEMLVTMLGLAMTQAGTFGAAFEIVKESSIFARERAVNLRIGAYVGSKVLVLGAFAIIQVASSLLIVGAKLDLEFEPILVDVFGDNGGIWELAVTLLLSVLASLMMGLFISSIVPNQNVVLYVILGNLFVQIILSGALFPLPDSDVTQAVSKGVISHWTMDALGSTVDLRGLNDQGRYCMVIENLDPTKDVETEIICDASGLADEDIKMTYEHDEEHLQEMWLGLLAHIAGWCVATMVVQSRKKPG